MKLSFKISFSLALTCLAGLATSAAMAQGSAAPLPPPPDPTHIPFFPTPLALPPNIPWKGDPARGEEGYSLIGGGSGNNGMYAGLTKWLPGHHSHPHYHDQMRYIYVVSGTWWVSSSNKEDPTTMYPIHAGSFVTDVANTVHWDGAKEGDEPAVILLFGMGPVHTTYVDEQGKPLPPTPVGALAHPQR